MTRHPSRELEQAANFVEGCETTQHDPGVELSDGRGATPELTERLRRVLHAVAAGRTVTAGPLPEELTTSAAADMSQISRPTLMKLVREQAIPSHRVNSHTCLRTHDVLAFRRTSLERPQRAFPDLRALEE